MNSEDNGAKGSREGRSSLGNLMSVAIGAFFMSFARTVLTIAYLGLFASEFLANPKLVDFVAGPLSFVGLWLVLYNFDLVAKAARR